MIKYFLIFSIFALSACNEENDAQSIRVSGGWSFQLECLDGIEYWVGHQRLSVRIEPETMTYVRCGE
jgi:hypothetical protein